MKAGGPSSTAVHTDQARIRGPAASSTKAPGDKAANTVTAFKHTRTATNMMAAGKTASGTDTASSHGVNKGASIWVASPRAKNTGTRSFGETMPLTDDIMKVEYVRVYDTATET